MLEMVMSILDRLGVTPAITFIAAAIAAIFVYRYLTDRG